MAFRNGQRFRRHTKLLRSHRDSADGRILAVRAGGGRIRPHDERQGPIPRRPDDQLAHVQLSEDATHQSMVMTDSAVDYFIGVGPMTVPSISTAAKYPGTSRGTLSMIGVK